MLIKLEKLNVKQHAGLAKFLASKANHLEVPAGFQSWADFSDTSNPRANWVKKLKLVRLIESTEKRGGFSVSLDVLTEARLRIPGQPAGGREFFITQIPFNPLLKMFAALDLYPAAFTGLEEYGDALGRSTDIVTLGRAGSGDMPVRAPSDDWVRWMRRLSNFNYGKISIVIQTEFGNTDYGGYPGCVLWVHPGDEKGGSVSENIKEVLRNTPEELSRSNDHDEAFGISTNFRDLVEFHEALGRAIDNMRARRSKEK